MTALLALTRAGIRRRRGPLVGLALVVALGIGTAIASLEAAARTDSAYPKYLRRADVGELVVNPSLITERAEAVIASTPGVRAYTSDSLLTATPDRGEPRTQVDVDSDGTQVRVSTDGRYVQQDRPVVHQGRMIGDGAEAFVNLEMAEALGLHVGDALPLAFWPNSYNSPGLSEDKALLEPLGRAEARVVGIGAFADEVLAEGLYPRHRALVTPEVGSRFDCTFPHPSPDDARPLQEIVTSMVPRGCAMSYRYFSILVDGGDSGVGALVDRLSTRFAEENDRLPSALRAENIGFEVTPTVIADERVRVQRSLDPAVTALRLFGIAAGACTTVVALLGAVRVTRRDEEDARTWRALGGGRALRSAGIAAPLAAAWAAGLAASVVVGWLASGTGPLASARAVEPTGRLGLSAVVLIVIGASAVLLAAGTALAATLASRTRPLVGRTATSRPSRALAPSANPSLTLGVRAAAAGAGSRALLAASMAAVSSVLATVVFGASLGALVSKPSRFGWPYDVAAMINFGYGETTDPAAIAATLDRAEVQRWGLASVSGPVTINGETMPSVAGRSAFDGMRLPVVDGELPVAVDEIALGTLTAKRLNLDVGAKVRVRTHYGEREATVRGLVVLPPVGPFQSDRSSLGTGVLLSAPFYEATLADTAGQLGTEPRQLADSLSGFVAVDLRPGVDAHRFLADIADQLPRWDTNGVRPFVYAAPVRPAAVANVAAMQAVPAALAGVLALAMGAGLMLAMAVATRSRRRELAVLRALGCVGRQLRATVRWQALTVVGAGLAVGMPVGVACGRIAYVAFANSLGTLPQAEVPLLWLLAIGLATIGVGLSAAAGPSHRVARLSAGDELRNE